MEETHIHIIMPMPAPKEPTFREILRLGSRRINVAQQGYDFRKVSSEWLPGLGSEIDGIARLES
jgi:hypothetical protein